MKRLLAATLLLSFTVFSLSIQTQKVEALSGSEFDAGNIIDDGMFFNGGNLTGQQIQIFLNSKVPQCETNHARSSSPNDSGAPYTCLKDYRQNTWAIGRDSYCNGFSGGNKSAAEIIYEVSVSCGVNPKVILITLQKEQSFITDTWPWTIQYEKATGFGCPDNPPSNWPTGCDPDFTGFFRQVYYGARQFKRYAQDTQIFTNYRPHRSNYVQYNPNGACGGTNVYIHNQATSGLYTYTPYQPNTAALSNLYGTGDGCSAYGNRNFWRMFNDWFGTVRSAPWAYQFVAQQVYTDATRSTAADTNNMLPDKPYRVTLIVKNIGTQTWQKNVVRLAPSNPRDRASQFCDWSWANSSSCNRVTTMFEDQVAPGQYATFEFTVKTPMPGGIYNEYFGLVADGVSWLNDIGLYWTFKVWAPTFTWQRVSQESYTDETKSTPVNTSQLNSGQRTYMVLKVRNTGSITWWNQAASPLRLGTSNPRDRASQFCDSTWQNNNCNRPARLKESGVAPGEVGTFEFWTKAPLTSSDRTSNEYFNLVIDGYRWLDDIGLYWSLTTKATTYKWAPTSQAIYTNSTKNSVANAANLAPNTRYYMVVKARNDSNFTWQQNYINLGTSNPRDRASQFCDSTWRVPQACNRTSTLVEAQVAPGQTGTYEFWITTPPAIGTYNEYFSVVADGVTWMNDPGMYWTLLVK